MSERRLYLDVGPGESRGVVTLGGRPERLLIRREGEAEIQRLGARLVARVRAVDRASGMAFLDVGEGPDAALNLSGGDRERLGHPIAEGQAVEVEIRAEARRGKGPTARLLGPAEGQPRLVAAAPGLEDQLRAFAPRAAIAIGSEARERADEAQAEALEQLFPLSGGGTVAIEPTRALTAVDVDLGDRPGADSKRVARAANLAALATAARVLRLKGLGGLVVVDFVGRGHDGAALLAAARAAFAPDNPGVALGAISRFGALELTIPRRARPAIDILTDADGRASPLTEALALARALEREALADGGGRFVGRAAPEVVKAAAAPVRMLNARLGGRLSLEADHALARDRSEVARG